MTEQEDPYEEFASLFYSDGFRIASEALKNGINKESILFMQEKIFQHIEEFLDMFNDQCWEQDQRVDCKKGCSWCCSQSVMILPQEAIYISNFLKKHRDVEYQEMLAARVKEKNRKTASLPASEFLHAKIACPFLIDNACTIYEARPMGCRLFLSSSESSCKAEYLKPKQRDIYPLLYEFPLRIGRLLNEGACNYLTKQNITPFEWTFESSMLVALDEQKIKDWLDGNNSFQTRDLSEEEVAYINKFDISSGES